uniref:L-cystine transporter n=1 Tax=Thaumasiovibrio occultus TaxID=1891184 RepID=UPI000B354FD6|nr:L-cystine transporter [Thaumasiovibrio occultus]
MTLAVIANIAIFVLILAFLYRLQATYVEFTRRVFAGLGLGIVFGGALQLYYGQGSEVIARSIEYFDIVGVGYVRFLQMIIYPLVMVSIVSAILRLKGGSSLGKISGLTIGVLVVTTMIAATVGIVFANVFGLNAEGLVSGAAEMARGEELKQTLGAVNSLSFAKMAIDFIPANPFLDLTGARRTSTIAVVIFAVFVGIAATGIAKKKPEEFALFEKVTKMVQAIVMRMVTLVLRLTPFGVMALMTKVISGSNYSDILALGSFVVASYASLLTMFAIHLLIIASLGFNPVRHVKKILPVLSFAFTSRTSAGAIPLNVKTQEEALGIPAGIANFAASFGSTIGQNGCAGIYPAMLAVMIAPTVGIDPMDLGFLIPLVAIITVSSFGVAGVGGGATFAALIVLSAMDLPVALAGLLISIEPLIDMGRTALNVSGSITAGTVTSKLLGETDMTVFNSDTVLALDSSEEAA